MAVCLRLKRLGTRHRPFYRLAAIDKRRQRDGLVLEEVGFYNPLAKDGAEEIRLDLDRCKYWLSVGAQPSATVASLLKKAGLTAAAGTKVEAQPANDQLKATIASGPRKKAQAPKKEAKAEAAAEAAPAAEAPKTESAEEKKE